jgi:TonB family protein
MKSFYALFIVLLISHLSYAMTNIKADTTKKANSKSANKPLEFEPEYPGGIKAFNSYITKQLHYPDAARLMCINGKVYVSFTIERDGKVADVSALNCLGAGCESEAVRVVQKSRPWKPAFQNGEAVKMKYIVPIEFNMENERVYMENLRASGFGFVFSIKGTLYSLDEAEDILGKTFKPEKIESAEPFHSQNTEQKFGIHHKKEVYLLVIKST